MNILFLVVVAIFAVAAGVGYYNGFIKIVASLAASILTMVLVVALTPYVSDVIMNTFPLEQSMQEKCREMVKQKEDKQEEPSRDAQISWIEESDFPDVIQQLLLTNNNDEVYDALGVDSFADYLGSYLAKLIANILSFILLVIVGNLVVQIILKALGLVSKIPVVGGVNRLAGGVLGLGFGLLIVWCLFVIITLLYSTPFGKTCFENIMNNELLQYIYDNNILMNSLTKIRG